MVMALILPACSGGSERRIWLGLFARRQHGALTGDWRGAIEPGTAEDLVANEDKLRDDAQQIKMWAVGEEKVPQSEDLW